MSVRGNVVVVESAAEYERLIRHPASVEGWFDAVEGTGEVTFTTVAQAQQAYIEG